MTLLWFWSLTSHIPSPHSPGKGRGTLPPSGYYNFLDSPSRAILVSRKGHRIQAGGKSSLRAIRSYVPSRRPPRKARHARNILQYPPRRQTPWARFLTAAKSPLAPMGSPERTARVEGHCQPLVWKGRPIRGVWTSTGSPAPPGSGADLDPRGLSAYCGEGGAIRV